MSRPASNPRRRGSEPATVQVLLIGGFVLAVAASVVMVIADSERWLRIAVLLGLWAALIAAFAVVRSRRQARAAELRQEEATRIYELELHREVAARREFEATLVERTRGEVEAKHKEELDGVRDQLDRLTTALSRLLDGDLLVERLTLSAESTRVRAVGEVRSVGEHGRFGGVSRQQLITSLEGSTLEGSTLEGSTVEGSTVEGSTVGPGWGPDPAVVFGPEPPAGIPIRPAYLDDVPENAPFAGSSEDTTLIPKIVDDAGPSVEMQGSGPDDEAVVGDEGATDASATDVGAPDGEPDLDVLVDADVLDGAALGESGVLGDQDAPEESEPVDALGERADTDPDATESGADTDPDHSETSGDGDETSGDAGETAEDEVDLPTSESSEDAGDELLESVRHVPIDRPDAPSTAWTLQHRRVTPASPHTVLPVETGDAETEAVEPEAGEPDVVEPDTAEIDAVEADAVEPDPAEPDAVEPDATGPDATELDAIEPERVEPEPFEPAADPGEPHDHEVGHSGGVTVAELLRAYGGGGSGRRRRRLDDDESA